MQKKKTNKKSTCKKKVIQKKRRGYVDKKSLGYVDKKKDIRKNDILKKSLDRQYIKKEGTYITSVVVQPRTNKH